MSSELILVTGASGYLGAHVVHQLLEKGYRVRGTARGAKLELTRQSFVSYGDKFEVVNVSDVAIDDISEHLKGVTAVIHTAAPLSSRGDAKFILRGAIEGSINIIRQAEKAGVKKIIYTSSIAAVINPSGSLTAADWNSMTYDQAVQSDVFTAYAAAKSLAEKAVWDFVDTHKHLEVTTFCPPFFYGPFAPGFSIPPNDYSAISTTKFIHRFLTPVGTFPPFLGYIDVRDLARAHVGALSSPPESAIGRKRLPVASPYDLNYKTAVEFIGEKRPELKDRLVDANKAPKFPFDKMALDLKRVEEVTGVKSDSYIPWQDTILETVDDLVKMEKDWASQGVSVEIPVA